MIHHLQMHVEPSSWPVLPPSGQTRDNNHRLVPEVNRHLKNGGRKRREIEEKKREENAFPLVSGWLESEFEDFSAPQLGVATMSPDLIHNRQPESASDIMNY